MSERNHVPARAVANFKPIRVGLKRSRVRWKEWKGSKAVEASSQGLKVWSYSCCQRRIFKEWREKLGRSKLWNWRDSRDVNFCQLSISATSKAGDVTPGADGEKIEIQWNVKSSGMENWTALVIIINSLQLWKMFWLCLDEQCRFCINK